MNARCPYCKEDGADVNDRRRGESGGLVVSFECPACDQAWEVTF